MLCLADLHVLDKNENKLKKRWQNKKNFNVTKKRKKRTKKRFLHLCQELLSGFGLEFGSLGPQACTQRHIPGYAIGLHCVSPMKF